MRNRLTILVLLLALVVLASGCDFYTDKTRAEFAQEAQFSGNIASEAAAGRLTPADTAYYLECFHRAFVNWNDAGNWERPTYIGPPTNRPASLPWTPVGGENPARPTTQPSPTSYLPPRMPAERETLLCFWPLESPNSSPQRPQRAARD
jgi:hypothetical protein